ncbi:hypothetical protein GS429_17000 [Natronorubrum sp. JWXQ-INN-674]|uniref:Blue (type 1) copper domain-containing protein n=2 Tax=Natronorubrum halalkaliphilum TaxID=2691917 RepID=A0A6B0VRX8_9EURY|nr:hypothetical protein [Natronorubrum halalkaliphilum]
MTDSTHSRRTMLKLTGAAAATALVAGCSDDDDNGNGNGNGNGGFNMEAGETIELNGLIGGWEGISPDEIAGEENPTLILEDGEDYEIGWPEGDGNDHNIEIWDENDELVEDYQTDTTTDTEPGDDQMIDITATEEMAYYVCEPHDNAMRGEIQVE